MTTRTTVMTKEAALLVGENPRNFVRWAKAHGIDPVRKIRIGRSTRTVWDIQQLTDAARRAAGLDNDDTAR